MGQQPPPTRSAMPRWMVLVAVLLVLAASVAVWRVTRPPTGGLGGGDEPLVRDDVAAAIADARALAVVGDVDSSRVALNLALSSPFSADALGYREVALLEWELVVLDLMAPGRSAALETAVQNAYGAFADARPPLRPGKVTATRYSFGNAERLLMSRMPDGLADRDAPSHALACAYVEAVLQGGHSTGRAVLEHVLAMGEAGPRAVPAVVAAHARLGRFHAHQSGAIRGLLARLPRDAVESALAAAAQDERRDVLTRRACERWLGEVADLPIALSSHGAERDLLRDAFPEGEILAAWTRLRDLPSTDAYRARLELAAAEFAVAGATVHDREQPADVFQRKAPRTQADALQGWIFRHTGLEWGRNKARDLDPFLSGERDIVGALLRAGGLSPNDVDPLTVLAAMDVQSSRPYLHQCLTLLVADDITPPTWLAGSGTCRELVSRWRAALDIAPVRMPVRVSRWALHGGRWSVVEQDETEVIEDGPDVTSESLFVLLASREEVAFGARVPGTAWDVGGPPGLHRERVRARLVRLDDGLELQGGYQYLQESVGPGGSVGNSGERWTVPFTVSPNVGVGAGGTPDWFRNRLVLLRPEPPGVELTELGEGPWDEARWRAAIVADLGRLAEIAEASDPWWDFHNVHQRTLWNLSAICMTLHVPEALPPLRRLLAVAPKWETQLSADLLLLAALRSGADDLASSQRVRFLAAGSKLDGTVEYTIGPGPKYWLRLLFDAETPQMRELAVSAIVAQQATGWSEELADDLRSAYESGHLQAAPELTGVLAQHPGGSATTFRQAAQRHAVLVPFVVVMNVAAFLLLCIAVPGLVRGDPWPRVSAVLVAFGVVYAAFSLRLMELPLLPGCVGHIVSAVGAWGLRSVVRSRAADVAVGAFCLAAAASLLWMPAEGLFAFVAVVAVTVLGRDVFALVPVTETSGPRRPRTRAAPRMLVLAFVLCVLGAGVTMTVTHSDGRVILPTVLVAGAVGWVLGIFAPTMVRFDPAAPRRAFAPLFVLAYVLPVGVRLGLQALAGLEVMDPWSPGDMALFAVTALPATAVLWSLGRLIDGTRVLAVR